MPKNTNKKNTQFQNRDTETFAKVKKFLWLRDNFAYCLAMVTLIWFVGIGYYIENFIGWTSIFALNPSDFGELIFTVTVPLCMIWLALAYLERSSSIDESAKLLQTYVDGLMYPDENASQNAKAIAQVLQSEIGRLRQENHRVEEQAEILKNGLADRLADFANILQQMDTYSAKTLTELNDGIKMLADKCTYITGKTMNAADNVRDCSVDISKNADKFLSKIIPLVDEITTLSANIKNNIADNKSNLMEIKTQLASCAELSRGYINDMLEKTGENTVKVEKSFYKAAEEYDMMYKKLDASISSVEGKIDEQRRLVTAQNQVLDYNADLLNNKLSVYNQSLVGEIDKMVQVSAELEKHTKQQVSALQMVNSETNKAIQGIGGIFDEKRGELERKCEHAITSMQNVIIAINKETEKLASFTAQTQAKNFDLQNIAETIVDKVGDISTKLALKTDTLKDKAVEVIDKFNEANEIISRSAEKMNTSSGMLVSNSQQGLKLMEEQNFYITNTLNSIDMAREKLDKLNADVKDISTDIAETLSDFSAQMENVEQVHKTTGKINPTEPVLNQELLIKTSQSINKVLKTIGINIEKIYEKQDMFDLWQEFIAGKQEAFTLPLKKMLTHKCVKDLRKTFDDNITFHNQTINFLFLMDLLVKDVLNPHKENTDELINFSVNASLEKIYFILVKSLNSAD